MVAEEMHLFCQVLKISHNSDSLTVLKFLNKDISTLHPPLPLKDTMKTCSSPFPVAFKGFLH